MVSVSFFANGKTVFLFKKSRSHNYVHVHRSYDFFALFAVIRKRASYDIEKKRDYERR